MKIETRGWVRLGSCLLLILATTIGRAADAPDAAPPEEQLPAAIQIVSLEAFPPTIELDRRFAYRQLLLNAITASGERLDVTRLAHLETPLSAVSVSREGLVRASADGTGELIYSLGAQKITVPVTVTGQQAAFDASFVRDVMPVMSKMGCNAGTCHGSDQGKNGFKLSLRGYDPEFDHRALTDDLAGRRFNRSAPDQSLMLLKLSGGVPHVGGVLTRAGDPYYELVRNWIAGGVKFDKEAPRVSSIEVFPKDPQIPLPGMRQQMVVMATYSDGTLRDVTAEAFIDSSLTEVAECSKLGLVTAIRRGEAAVLARFEGNYAATTITVMGDRTGFVWQEPPHNNYIDELVYKKLKTLKVEPSELCTDADFARRCYLDLTGVPPSPEVLRKFLADPRETWIKRDELIDQLIGSPQYVEYWTNKWADLLQVNRRFLSEKGAWALRSWITHALTENMPYDQFAHAILTGSGSTFVNPAASYLRVLREPAEAMENTTQLFLGIRFNCNKCHDHPFERWTQNQYYELAGYFAQVGRKPGPNPEEEIVFDMHSGELPHVKTGQVVPVVFPYQKDIAVNHEASRREQFAEWAVSRDNQYFAVSFVNRTWSYLLGVGLIEPVDDIRAGNPPSNPELLNRLTKDFIESGFDTRQLIQLICRSRAYQHSLNTNRWNEDDQVNYSHAVARRLPAETLYDTVKLVTGSQIDLPGVPSGFMATQLPDSSVELPGGFLGLFGRPPRESACECERSSGVVLGQALNLVNGPVIAEAISDPDNRVTRLVNTQPDDAQVVDELFMAILSRPPKPQEMETGVKAIREAENRLAGAQDLAWALINSPAFLFNH